MRLLAFCRVRYLHHDLSFLVLKAAPKLVLVGVLRLQLRLLRSGFVALVFAKRSEADEDTRV